MAGGENSGVDRKGGYPGGGEAVSELPAPDATRPAGTGPDETLQDLIDAAKTRRDTTSVTALARIARDGGFAVNHSTLSRMATGTYQSQPEGATLAAVAFLAGVPFERARRAAGHAARDRPPFAYQLPHDVDLLDERERAVVLHMITVLLSRHR